MFKRATQAPFAKQPVVRPVQISLPTKPIPDRPDFCPPFNSASDPLAWLSAATDGLSELCKVNELRHRKSIDEEVRAAIYLGQELEINTALQSEWCKLTDWLTVSRKRPRQAQTNAVFEEVFRLIWAIRRKDQDGFELRYRAFKAVYDSESSPDEIIKRIRMGGGYRAFAKGSAKSRVAAPATLEPLVEQASRDLSLRIESVAPKIRTMLLGLAQGEEAWVKIRALGVASPTKIQRLRIVAKRHVKKLTKSRWL